MLNLTLLQTFSYAQHGYKISLHGRLQGVIN